MLVNKDLKITIVRPTREYLDRMLYYYPVRSMVQKAVNRELLLMIDDARSKVCIFDPFPHSVKKEENVECTMTKVQTSNSLVISGEPSRCFKSISGQVINPEQQIDLLGFWEVGKKD